ncbi:GntR family transcriptional regulator [Chitinophaga terrae (ex Kim and Jung 2007)]|nr:GntR family transcriptional regulator [Chitinophaga terrae (ex Kim and Jung 2007)]
MNMVKVGAYNLLRVKKEADFGVYLEGVDQEILLPSRFVPKGTKVGDELEVFLYHDSENRLIATTQKPFGIAGDVVLLKAVSVTKQGAFLDWGLMKDLFVPASQQLTKMVPGQEYLVRIYIDDLTGRLAATEKIDQFLSNDDLTVQELELVDVIVYRRTDIGYVVIINNKHTGIIHHNEVFRTLETGDKLKGFIRRINGDKIDVVLGKPGFNKVEDTATTILRLLDEHDGYLPYNDKSSPEEIQEFFQMSKKTFKMTIGNLYKQRKIEFTQTGIKKIEE